MAVLRYLDVNGFPANRTLDVEHFLIGRAATCNISFDDDMISREHVRIDLEPDGRFRIRDLGSRNKTYVNGELVAEALLSPGDVLRVGEHVLEFLDDTTGVEPFTMEFLTPDRSDPPNVEWLKVRTPTTLTLGQLEKLALLAADPPLTARAEDIADTALGRLLMDLQADRGFIALRGEKKTELRPLAHRALGRAAGRSLTPVSQSFVFAPLLQSVAGRYPRTAAQVDAKLGFAASAVVAPLTFHGEPVGVLYADRPSGKKPFGPEAVQHCVAAGAQLGAVIGEASRRLARLAPREGATWMTLLRRTQQAVLTPAVSNDTFDVGFQHFPGRVRCGDLCEVVHLDEQRSVAVLLDAGGKGLTGLLQARAVGCAVRTTVKVTDEAALDPATMFNELNRSLANAPTRQIVPCTFVALDLAAGKLTYINAGGMPPLLMVGPGRLVTLDQTELLLGIDADYVYEATRVDLPDPFRLICHTDGLTDGTSAAGEPLGHARLHEALLQREAFAAAEEIVARIARLWSSHLAGSQGDDDAMVLVFARGAVE